VLEDLDSAPISEKDRTLYAFIRKMVADSLSIGQADVDAARRAGWSDEALYDAITVCSLFQFYNNWIDATGVSDMPVFGYEMSGHRLATQGYAQSEPPSALSEAKIATRPKAARPAKKSGKSRKSVARKKSTRSRRS
jgi:hypothetical protein